MPLELEGELVQIPDSHLGFVRPRCNCMVSVPSGFDFVACLWKLESLDEFYLTFDMFSESPFSLYFRRPGFREPVGYRGRGSRDGAVDGVNLDIAHLG